jgi:hypothetical protein
MSRAKQWDDVGILADELCLMFQDTLPLNHEAPITLGSDGAPGRQGPLLSIQAHHNNVQGIQFYDKNGDESGGLFIWDGSLYYAETGPIRPDQTTVPRPSQPWGTVIRRNSSAPEYGPRRRINLIEGSGVSITIADDAVNNEVDVTIASSGGGGSSITIREIDGVPSIIATIIEVDIGFLTNVAGVARIQLPLTTQGDMLFFNGTINTRLGSNTAARARYICTMSGGNPQYELIKTLWPSEQGVAITTVGITNDHPVADDTGVLKINCTNNHIITGFAAPSPANSKLLFVENRFTSTSTITIAHQSGSSSAANRVVSDTGADYNLGPGQSCTLVYDTLDSRWITIGRGNGATGSGSVTSVALTVPTPLQVTGSPITSSGTFAVTWAELTTNGILYATSSTTVGQTTNNSSTRPHFIRQTSSGTPSYQLVEQLWPKEQSGTISANQTNYTLNDDTGVLKLQTNSAIERRIDGISAPSPANSKLILIENRPASPGDIILGHLAGSSSNQVNTQTRNDIRLRPRQGAILCYNTLDSKWATLCQPFLIEGTGDPNGSVSATMHSFYYDTENEDLWINIDDSSTWILIGGNSSNGLPWEAYRFRTGSTNDRWYTSGHSASAVSPAVGFSGSAGDILVAPFISPAGGRLDGIAFYADQSSAPSINVRLGIYSHTSISNPYPDELLVEAAEVNLPALTPFGWYSKPLSNIALNPRVLYWLAISTNSTNLLHSNIAGSDAVGVIGYASNEPSVMTKYPGAGYRVTPRTYGALPATFPAGAEIIPGSNSQFIPAIFLRYAS